MGSFLSTIVLFSRAANMKFVTFSLMFGFGVSLPQNVRETWVDICNDDSGNKCCADTGMSGHEYWIIRTQGSWKEQDIACRMGNKDDAKLAVFESRRENDCVTKYLLDEYEDTTAHQYAIGINVEDDDKYKGVYEWKRVDTSTSNLDAASLSFTNWVPAAPLGKSCVSMSAGKSDLNNGRWTDVDCNTDNTLYAICEYAPITSTTSTPTPTPTPTSTTSPP